jgi:arginase family enzyme
MHDLGDIDLGESVEHSWEKAAERLSLIPPGALLTSMGGDHCSTIPVLVAQARRHPNLAVLWVDAHPDLNEYSRGGAWTCGCALRRSIDLAGLRPSSVIHAGGRDFDYDEIVFMQEEGILLLTTSVIFRDPQAAGQIIAERVGNRPLHISFDIDALDPAFAPGTEIPSAGGLTTRQALELLAAIGQRSRLVGFDVVEVSPPYDNNDITTLAALKLIFEFWGLAWRQAQ